MAARGSPAGSASLGALSPHRASHPGVPIGKDAAGIMSPHLGVEFVVRIDGVRTNGRLVLQGLSQERRRVCSRPRSSRDDKLHIHQYELPVLLRLIDQGLGLCRVQLVVNAGGVDIVQAHRPVGGMFDTLEQGDKPVFLGSFDALVACS